MDNISSDPFDDTTDYISNNPFDRTTDDIESRSVLLTLPEAIWQSILERLSPKELAGLCKVCTFLRDICRSDRLWEIHVEKKWGGVIGDVVYKEWKLHITTAKEKRNGPLYQQNSENGSLGSFSGTWPTLYLRSYLDDCSHLNSSLSNSFMMALYVSLETGKFWFPVQIYRGLFVREALVRYDSKSDTFRARRQSGGWHKVGSNIQWDKLRAPPIDMPPCDEYVSDCLQDLKPGDHVEIQRRSRNGIPYGRFLVILLSQLSDTLATAGAIGSSQLLMLSGIGPAKHMKAHGINVVLDQPQVGQGMTDNPMNLLVVPSLLPVEVTLVQTVGITKASLNQVVD
ncbi:unnamed protein product [Sphenostylis stenocarpa]|uniref:F-box domain-containing protein n=1 Tax=Sphenostylis stenocarpa TaxID=92480 RepID=A0AA86S541_9FABA|nr:unnamed protein product [Sphenostylis stenocarpa]